MASPRSLWTKRLTPIEEEAHRDAAFVAIRRLYAAAAPLWKFCKRGPCRRHRRCCGADTQPCLRRAWPLLSRAQQDEVYRQVRAGGPRHVPPATPSEYRLRGFPPTNFVL